MKTCPYCAEDIPNQAAVCPICKMDTRRGFAPDDSPRPAPARSSSNTWIIVIAVAGGAALLVIPCLIALLLPAVQSAREAARRSQCGNNMKQIMLALHTYHDAYGSFPPAYVADESGRPLYSWRVLILPYLDQGPMYDRFDLTRPWDSPANRFALERVPQVFRCPSRGDSDVSNTHIAGVFGPDCMFRGAQGVRISEITDGTANTLMIGEVTTPIPWTSPQDVDVSRHPALGGLSGFDSHHVGGTYFARVDGSVQFLNESTPPNVLRAMFTSNGGEIVTGW